MALRNIIKDEDPFLRKTSRAVVVFDRRLHQLLDDMAETMRAADGLGLAAVQIGVLRRVVTVEADGELIELINPVILEQSEETKEDAEGCLSFPGTFGLVERSLRVRVQAQDRHGALIIAEGEGLNARALLHEIAHLNGKLFVDLVTRYLDPEEIEQRKPEEE